MFVIINIRKSSTEESDKMKKSGFTLVELLGVIVIVAALSLIVFPIVMGQFRKNKSQISAVTERLIEEAASLYVDANPNQYELMNGNVYCVTLNQLVNSGNLSEPLIDSSTGDKIPLTYTVKISVINNQFYYSFNGGNSCVESRS